MDSNKLTAPKPAVASQYHFNDFEIEVVFHDDKSIWEIFHLGRYINYSDIKPLLKANAGSGHTWRYDGMNHRWERSGDPKYIAYRWPGHEDYFCIEDVKACEAFWNGETSELRGF